MWFSFPDFSVGTISTSAHNDVVRNLEGQIKVLEYDNSIFRDKHNELLERVVDKDEYIEGCDNVIQRLQGKIDCLNKELQGFRENYRTKVPVRFTKDDKPGDIVSCSYNGHPMRIRVPIDVIPDHWYNIETNYIPLKEEEIDTSKIKVFTMKSDRSYIDYTVTVKRKPGSTDKEFQIKIDNIKHQLSGMINTTEMISQVLIKLHYWYDGINDLRGTINLFIDQLKDKFNDTTLEDERELSYIEKYGDRHDEIPYSLRYIDTIMNNLREKIKSIIKKVETDSIALHDQHKYFHDKLFNLQLELHTEKETKSQDKIDLIEKKHRIGKYIYSFAKWKTEVITTYGAVFNNQLQQYHKACSVSLPENRLWGCSYGMLYSTLNLVPCKHDTETDISKKDFILLLNVNKNIQKMKDVLVDTMVMIIS